MCRREKATLKILHAFTDSVIKARRKELLCNDNISDDSFDSTGSKRKKALLDLLLMATVDGAPLTDLDIREEVDTFMFEGHDTTTSGISFCLYNLAKYPDIQQRVLKEICSEIDGSEADDGVLSQQHLNKFRYLELVIKESLRLYPSVPYFARRLSEEITAGGYTLPKNCSVYVAPYLMGRDASIFPDPLVFNPDRFDVVTTCEKVNPYGYVPFSAGKNDYFWLKYFYFDSLLQVHATVLGNDSPSTSWSQLWRKSCDTLNSRSRQTMKISQSTPTWCWKQHLALCWTSKGEYRTQHPLNVSDKWQNKNS